MVGHVERMGRKVTNIGYWLRKPEGKRPLGGPRCRWLDNARLDLGDIGWADVD
jgi:hypothetical protein